jgi:hypothetical protein
MIRRTQFVPVLAALLAGPVFGQSHSTTGAGQSQLREPPLALSLLLDQAVDYPQPVLDALVELARYPDVLRSLAEHPAWLQSPESANPSIPSYLMSSVRTLQSYPDAVALLAAHPVHADELARLFREVRESAAAQKAPAAPQQAPPATTPGEPPPATATAPDEAFAESYREIVNVDLAPPLETFGYAYEPAAVYVPTYYSPDYYPAYSSFSFSFGYSDWDWYDWYSCYRPCAPYYAPYPYYRYYGACGSVGYRGYHSAQDYLCYTNPYIYGLYRGVKHYNGVVADGGPRYVAHPTPSSLRHGRVNPGVKPRVEPLPVATRDGARARPDSTRPARDFNSLFPSRADATRDVKSRAGSDLMPRPADTTRRPGLTTQRPSATTPRPSVTSRRPSAIEAHSSGRTSHSMPGFKTARPAPVQHSTGIRTSPSNPRGTTSHGSFGAGRSSSGRSPGMSSAGRSNPRPSAAPRSGGGGGIKSRR